MPDVRYTLVKAFEFIPKLSIGYLMVDLKRELLKLAPFYSWRTYIIRIFVANGEFQFYMNYCGSIENSIEQK